MNTNSTVKYEDYYNSLKTNAEDSYTQALKNAELNRQKAVLEAGNQYNSSRAISGANAQALSSMGLTGSGYSAYLDSQAYAQKQGAINSAYQREQDAVNQAQAIKDSAYVTAEGLYTDYLLQQETNRKNAYNNIYGQLSQLPFSDIERLGAMYGLDAAAINELKNAKNQLTYSTLLGSEYGQKTLDNLVNVGYLMKEDITYDADGNQISTTPNALYTNLTKDMVKVDAADVPDMFKNQSYDVSKSALERLKPLVDDTTYAALEKQFNADFGVTTNGVTLEKGTIFERNIGKEGRKIEVRKGEDTYTVNYSGEKLSGELEKAAKNQDISNNEVFKLGGKLYIKIDDTYYGLKKSAKLFEEDDYDDLMALFN